MLTIKKHDNRRAVRQRTAKGTSHRNSEDRNAPITAVENKPILVEHRCLSGMYLGKQLEMHFTGNAIRLAGTHFGNAIGMYMGCILGTHCGPYFKNAMRNR